MSLFRGIKRVWNEGREDDALIREAAGRQPNFNNKCQFRHFGFYDLNTMPFYQIGGLSSAPRPTDFKVCQECFLASIAPCPSLAKKFVREIKSSKDPEELVQCAFSDPRNEPAWSATIRQRHEGPFMQRLQELATMEANLSKCPTLLKASDNKNPTFVSSFRIPRSQRLLQNSSGICEYHYAMVVKGGVMEDEFVRASNELPSPECLFGVPETAGFATIAFLMAEKTFNFKIFNDWLQSAQTMPDCTGVVDRSSKRYIVPAAQYATRDQIQVCERCYYLVFFPHNITRQYFREIPGNINGERHVCSINGGSAPGYLEAVLKATWKQDASIFLNHARWQAPIPTCPGSANYTPMRVWYASMAAENEPVTCCEACFHHHVKNSRLFGSFKLLANSNAQEAQQCLMSLNEVQDLFTKACKTGQISVFHKSIMELAQNTHKNAEEAEQKAQKARRDAKQPELDLSKVRGAAQQIRQIESLRDEIVKMASEAEIMTASAHNSITAGIIRATGCSPWAASGGSYTRYCDGHGNWFNSQGEAEGSQMQIEARMKLNDAHNLRLEVMRKRLDLSRMKAALGG